MSYAELLYLGCGAARVPSGTLLYCSSAGQAGGLLHE